MNKKEDGYVDIVEALKELCRILTPCDKSKLDYLYKDELLGDYWDGKLSKRLLDIVEALHAQYNILTISETLGITGGKLPDLTED